MLDHAMTERLIKRLAKLGESDLLAEKFREIEANLDLLTFPEDEAALARIAAECRQLAARAGWWAKTSAGR